MPSGNIHGASTRHWTNTTLMKYVNLVHLLAMAGLISLATPALATEYYVEQINVLPASPSDQDAVQLVVSGYLANTQSYVSGITATVDGFNVLVTIIASNFGGINIPVTVAHADTVVLGTLPAGTYTINLNGNMIMDSAPQAQHSFTVSGGAATVCDSLVLASVSWAPFSDTALLVHVFNPTSTLFDYPGFILHDANGDTLAKETVNFFGIGQESWHTLAIQPGATIPQGPFNGTLELWTLFGQELACSWNQSFDLCPPAPCAPLNVFLQNTGGGMTLGSFHYTVRQMGNEVAGGTFVLSQNAQYDSDSLCLPPGAYLMEVVPDQGPTGGQPFFGVGLGNEVQGPGAPLVFTTLSAVAFNFYGACSNGTQGIAVADPANLVLNTGNGRVSVRRTDGQVLGELLVFDAQGRIVLDAVEAGAQHEWSTAGWASGLYLLREQGLRGSLLTLRWVVP